MSTALNAESLVLIPREKLRALLAGRRGAKASASRTLEQARATAAAGLARALEGAVSPNQALAAELLLQSGRWPGRGTIGDWIDWMAEPLPQLWAR